MDEKYKCPECGSEDTIKSGSQLTKKWGKRQRRRCKLCATSFYADTAKIEKEVKK